MMAAPNIIVPCDLLSQAMENPVPGLLLSLLQPLINTYLSAETDEMCGAEYEVPSESRTTQRNGYGSRLLGSRVGTVEVQAPKLHLGANSPKWLLSRRKRSKSALSRLLSTVMWLECRPGGWRNGKNSGGSFRAEIPSVEDGGGS